MVVQIPIAVAALVLDGQVLLVHRHPSREWCPDCWDLVGGHIETSESSHEAASGSASRKRARRREASGPRVPFEHRERSRGRDRVAAGRTADQRRRARTRVEWLPSLSDRYRARPALLTGPGSTSEVCSRGRPVHRCEVRSPQGSAGARVATLASTPQCRQLDIATAARPMPGRGRGAPPRARECFTGRSRRRTRCWRRSIRRCHRRPSRC